MAARLFCLDGELHGLRGTIMAKKTSKKKRIKVEKVDKRNEQNLEKFGINKFETVKEKKEKKNRGKTKGKNTVVGKIRVNKKGFGFLISENQKENISRKYKTYEEFITDIETYEESDVLRQDDREGNSLPESSESDNSGDNGENLSDKKNDIRDRDDIFIGKDQLSGIMDGDTIAVKVEKKKYSENLKRGKIVKVLQRGHQTVVGTFVDNGNFAFVIPVKKEFVQDIYVNKKNFGTAVDGDMVSVEILRYGNRLEKAEGRVIDIIAQNDDPARDIKALIVSSGRELFFQNKVKREVNAIKNFKITHEEFAKRRDLREKYIVTIDGADSKDFDDAVSVEKMKNGNYLLGVHIADVSYFVKSGTYVDQEARNRANSVYLIDQVVPMLPEVLSNNLCSLVPKEDRLTISCDMEIDEKGRVLNHKIYESVINSKRRCTYDEIFEVISSIEKTAEDESGEVEKDVLDFTPFEVDRIREMLDLTKVLIRARDKRGSIDFDNPEAEIKLDSFGVPTAVFPRNRNIAHQLIEEFMLKANETVAEQFFWLNTPFVYRNHPKPNAEKMAEIKEFIGGLGIELRGDLTDVKPYMIRDTLNEIKNTKYQFIVSKAMLKSMEKAVYESHCSGHFGLALERYCHFTSPIRRYPDLMVHRIIRMFIEEGIEKVFDREVKKTCEGISKWSSEVERDTLELEREVDKMKIAQFMENNIGKQYDGIVSGVTSYGIHVEIEKCIEGMVRLSDLRGDFYVLDREKHRVVGNNTGKVISLGDKVKIEVLNASKESKEIDFILIEE